MKKNIVLIIFVSLFMQACGMQLIDPNARNNTLPNVPGQTTEAEFTIGGTAEGLPRGFDLDAWVNNLPYTIDENGNFTFPYTFDDFTEFEVLVGNLPGGYTCTVTNGTGTIDGANITDVQILCSCEPMGAIVGDGSSANPIEIWTAQQLNNVATSADATVRNKHYKQMCELDYAELSPTPIGQQESLSPGFSGSYDGQNFFIINYSSPASAPVLQGRKGLFGRTHNAYLGNIRLADFYLEPHPSMDGNNYYTGIIGSLVGETYNTLMENIYAENISIQTFDTKLFMVGGLVGYFDGVVFSTLVKQASMAGVHVNNVSIEAEKALMVGGLIGKSLANTGLHRNILGQNITLSACRDYCGGMIGYYGTQSTSDATGFMHVHFTNVDVKGNGKVGGLAGTVQGNIRQASVDGKVEVTNLSTGVQKRVGGMFGGLYTNYTQRNSFSVVDVFKGNNAVSGPFYGFSTSSDVQSNSYLSGLTCQGCIANSDISEQNSIIAYQDGLDLSQTNIPQPWDFINDWCLRNNDLPSLKNVPLSLCQ